ncbi:M48 family metallopeptidase [Candidatus Woesearchaeota archaeon]|nr:M48 family metallopeptidase [Candidatus Woesearchaeota archaeon]
MIVEKAYLELYPKGKLGDYSFSIAYSGKFSDYNANVSRKGKVIRFNLSRKWEEINDDVKMGLIQFLMNKLFGTKKHTQHMELYDIFLKKVHIAVPKTKTDPILAESFDRVNDAYLYGLIEKPNLEWGTDSFHKLGSYEYGSDTITISTILVGDKESLDYVMYHEMLHKKHKFKTKNGRSYHHTKEFLAEERKFKDFDDVDKKINRLVRRKKGFKAFF